MTASGHESSEGDRVTETGHIDLPDEQGNANAPTKTGSGQKTTTGHTESGSGPRTATDLAETTSKSERDETDSGQKTATARGKTATETSHVDNALDRLTVSAETGHESFPTESGLYDPS